MNREGTSTKGFLGWVERVGNKIPHPFILFVWLIVIILLISVLTALTGLSVVNPATNEAVVAKNLLSAEGATFILTSAIKNFTGFAPLGLVLTMALGIGMAEKIGLMSSFMRASLLGANPKFIVPIIAIIGICGNIASDAAIVIIPPIAAMIFLALGKNPLAGIALGYAATTGGFSANLMIAGTDGLLQGITNEASAIVNGPTIPIAANWYFMIVSTFVLTIVITLVNNKIVEPRLGKYDGELQVSHEEITAEERKALRRTGIVALVYILIIIAACIPSNSFMRNPETGSLVSGSILMKGLIPILLGLFLAVSITYGKMMGKIKTSGDIPRFMTMAIADMAPFIVLAFIIGQFIAYFNWSNLGLILAITGANVLESSGFTGIPFFIVYVLFCAFVNMFIGSGSAKWAILAPIFVPMTVLLGYHPAFTQVLYRIGDSATNIISPLFPYLPIILGYMNEYDKKSGIGTLLSTMIPYSLAMLVMWLIMAIIWFFAGLPLGPEGFLLI